MLKRKLSDLSIQMIIGAMLCLAYLPYIFAQHHREAPFIIGDSHYYRATAVSILEDGDLNLSNNVTGNPYGGFLALGKSNDPRQLVPKHPILILLCSLPFFALMGTTGYHRTAREVVGRRGDLQVRAVALDNHTKKFNQPLLGGLFRLLFHVRRMGRQPLQQSLPDDHRRSAFGVCRELDRRGREGKVRARLTRAAAPRRGSVRLST